MKSDQGTIILTGNMDGCHLGHQEMIRVLKVEAERRNLKPLILTFDPHPVHFFGRYEGLRLLTTLNEKIAIIENFDVEANVINFTHEFSQMSAEEYVREILVKRYNAKCWVTGFNHQFGKKSERSRPEDLDSLLNNIGLDRIVVNEIMVNEKAVSSSIIRSHISKKEIHIANELMGRPYMLSGSIVHGDKIGGKLGFKTANIAVNDAYKLIPPVGVYGGICQIHEKNFVAAINIGYRPTFKGKDLRIEAHLLDYSGDIYSQKATLQLHLHVRDELSFESTEGLKSQISQDVQCIRDYFNN